MSDNTALAIREEITEAKVLEYFDSAGITNNLLANEKKMFFNIAREFGLNPFKREIHITAYGEGDYRKCSIITGYEVYIKRAERTGKLDGWKVWTEGEGKSLKAVVEIYRKDQKYPFVHEVYYIECCQYNKSGQPNAIWGKQPRFMTKKVAIGQAFRLCFPDDLGGMPYEESEMPQEEPRNVTETTKSELERHADEMVSEINELAADIDTIMPEQETPPPPPPPPPNNLLYEQCKAGMNELKNIMLATVGDNSRVFSDDEYNVVKAALNQLIEKPVEERWAIISGLLDSQKEQLQIRFDGWAKKQTPQPPTATATGAAKPGRPSLAEEYRRTIAEKRQQTQSGDATVPAMYNEEEDDGFKDDLLEEPAAAPADKQLDIF